MPSAAQQHISEEATRDMTNSSRNFEQKETEVTKEGG
jgi:hypothetical protein